MNISYMFVCSRSLNTVFIPKLAALAIPCELSTQLLSITGGHETQHTATELHLFCAVLPFSLAFKHAIKQLQDTMHEIMWFSPARIVQSVFRFIWVLVYTAFNFSARRN